MTMPCQRGQPTQTLTSPASDRLAQKRMPTVKRSATTGKTASFARASVLDGATPSATSGTTISARPTHNPSGPRSTINVGIESHTAGVSQARGQAGGGHFERGGGGEPGSQAIAMMAASTGNHSSRPQEGVRDADAPI
jgi:hypothetical protein